MKLRQEEMELKTGEVEFEKKQTGAKSEVASCFI